MVRKLLGPVVLCVLASAVVLAADFWETKPFSMWSTEELQKILTDSPWSRNVSVLATRPGSEPEGSARMRWKAAAGVAVAAAARAPIVAAAQVEAAVPVAAAVAVRRCHRKSSWLSHGVLRCP